MRQFKSGANRNGAENKYEYFGFQQPLVEFSFAKYMHKHRHLEDGTMRDSNNWWKGFPPGVALQSFCRHAEDIKLIMACYEVYEFEGGRYVKGYQEIPKGATPIKIEDCINGAKFNLNAMMNEILNEK